MRIRPLLLFVFPVLAACQASTVQGDLSPADMDATTDPGDDFYRYANGGWLDRTEIPAEESSWGLGSEVNERNRKLLRKIMEDAAQNRADDPQSVGGKLGSFWSSGMNTAQIEAVGLVPLDPELIRIDNISDRESFARVVARLHTIGVGAVFDFGAEAALDDPTMIFAWATQGGLGLPDRDYYTREDEESATLREDYVAHVTTMFGLAGDDYPEGAAATVQAIETRLANSSLTQVALRDPSNYDRKITMDQARGDMPNFAWDAYLSGAGLEGLATLNQPMPDFFAELNTMLDEVPLRDWKTYLRWHLLRGYAGFLSDEFANESFAFYGTRLSGTPEMEPRWRRVLGAVNAGMGEAVGQLYVEQAFPPRAKERVIAMVQGILDVMQSRLESIDWMGPETRAQALEKLSTFGVKLGYPDEWRDWSQLSITGESYAANVMRSREYDFRYQIDKIGKPTDPNDWGMTPQMLNAYYHPLRNEIVFPAAILQPPFFSADADDPLNYGAIGAVIGHEITHGFDDSGSQFDADGRLRNWWTDQDRAEFEARTKKLIEQYSAFEPLPGVLVNGELTLGENIADLGGVSIALEAMQKANTGRADPMLGGLSREQRFFLAFARVWRREVRDEALKLQVNTDPHSPARYRVLGPLANLPEFSDAFAVPASAPMMLPESERAIIW